MGIDGIEIEVIHHMRRGNYYEWYCSNPIIEDGEIIVVKNIPGWWRRRKTRLKAGDGKTPFRELRYV